MKDDEESKDIKDEGDDSRVLGKRSREEKSTSRTGRTDKKAIVQAKKEDRSHAKRTDRSSDSTVKKSRPGSKEARLKKLGKWSGVKDNNDVKGKGS